MKRALPAPVVDPVHFSKVKRASVAQLLFRCARRLNDKALSDVAKATGLSIRASHTALFPHIDLEGTRQSDLAERLGVSKQAIHKLVSELESMGVLERAVDPSDGRATLVRFSQKKGRTLYDGMAVLAATEAQMSERLGEKRRAALHEALLMLDAWLDEFDPPKG
ncbi:MAG: MarR family winged helix-turn-helix transcriptional regulator [Polyangiaceae bacterium]